MTAVIKTERLTKAYGEHRGIIELDLEVAEGEIFGFLGPNGAGKTTTMRVLLDLIRPTSGRAEVFGIETTADPVAIHRRVGYLPGEFDLYDRLTGAQTIEYFGEPARRRRPRLRRRVSSTCSTSTRAGASASTARATSRRSGWSSHSSTSRTCSSSTSRHRASTRSSSRRSSGSSARPGRGPDGLPLVAHHRRGRPHLRPRRDHPRGPPRPGRPDRGHPRRSPSTTSS